MTDKLIGMELEFDARNGIANHICAGGTNAHLGIDGSGNCIEIRTDPYKYDDIKGFASEVANLVCNMLTHQGGVIYAGNGVNNPVSMHIHMNTKKVKTVLDYFHPLHAMLQGYADVSRLYARFDDGYGEWRDYRRPPHGIEIRGFPNPLTPMAIGFCFGYASQFYTKPLITPNVASLISIYKAYKIKNLENSNVREVWCQRNGPKVTVVDSDMCRIQPPTKQHCFANVLFPVNSIGFKHLCDAGMESALHRDVLVTLFPLRSSRELLYCLATKQYIITLKCSANARLYTATWRNIPQSLSNCVALQRFFDDDKSQLAIGYNETFDDIDSLVDEHTNIFIKMFEMDNTLRTPSPLVYGKGVMPITPEAANASLVSSCVEQIIKGYKLSFARK